MLTELPSEIVVHIAIYLETATDVLNLSQTCHRLHQVVTTEESTIFRGFVQTKFPGTATPAFWKDAACALTSRSRALDKLGIIGRFVIPSKSITRIGVKDETRRDNPTIGYRPAIDSYEIWNGDRWADKKEVLAWGAGHKLVMRTKQSGSNPQENWFLFNGVENASVYDDICGVHLLEPEQSKDVNIQPLIFGRMRGELVHIALSLNEATHDIRQNFITHGLELERTDLYGGTLAAHFANGCTAFYHAKNDVKDVEPFALIRPEQDTTLQRRYSKLLSESRVAVASGKTQGSLSVSTVAPDGIRFKHEIDVTALDLDERVCTWAQANTTAIMPLNTCTFTGSQGDVFLAAWGDGAIRLHDIRSPRSYEAAYRDTTDMNQVYSVHPFGNDHFLAGTGGNALLKIFDLRMGNTYSYLNGNSPSTTNKLANSVKKKRAHNFSLFLSAHPPIDPSNPRSRRRRDESYRGPIYTISTPSSSSPTAYIGIVDGVVRLDFASTDDLTGPVKDWYDLNLDLGVDMGQPSVPAAEDKVSRLAGYERPDPDDLSTTAKLRKQHGFWYPESRDFNEEMTGWDRRWAPIAKPSNWR
ncbi:hypothetical protein N7495_005494 [Penicillium taxi]|uniref:uncharacterized protein n=1 Tax=Penicillium taxi TaxID=168475 RepID=UPI002544F367|nr:uncharacterized protein N7495_005494 [Penicillium taxi]KAJ5893803.1 hypothetical protein N7495_005494 [Penicillium taxi]